MVSHMPDEDLKEFIREHFDRLDQKLDLALEKVLDINARMLALDKRMAALAEAMERAARGSASTTP